MVVLREQAAEAEMVKDYRIQDCSAQYEVRKQEDKQSWEMLASN